MQNVVLVGMPGAGKTTVGRALARQLSFAFVDSDKELVSRTGVPVATIFEIEGEAGFRIRESAVLADLLQRQGIVLATGGGAILEETNRTMLRENATVIYLRASLEAIWERTRRDSTRPLLQTANPRATLEQMLHDREPLYAATAHLTFDTGSQSAARLAGQIATCLAPTDTATTDPMPP